MFYSVPGVPRKKIERFGFFTIQSVFLFNYLINSNLGMKNIEKVSTLSTPCCGKKFCAVNHSLYQPNPT